MKKIVDVTSRHLLSLLFHPIVIFLFAAGILYQAWFFEDGYKRIIIQGAFSVIIAFAVARFSYSTKKIKSTLAEVEAARNRMWSPSLEVQRTLLRDVLKDIPFYTDSTVAQDPCKPLSEEAPAKSTLYLRGVELVNIRCFSRLSLSFENEDGPYLTTIILGDNAAGKSTLLRSIALGLCPESDAISLIKKMPGSILRQGTTQGSIVLHLRSGDGKFSGTIRTKIEGGGGHGQEVIRQTTDPKKFPWDQIFVCGYGTQRTAGRPSSHESYAARLAVATLFSETADLLNPEVVLLRRDKKTSSRLETALRQILLLDEVKKAVHPSDRGIELSGPWGLQPLSAVSDGYRSTAQWVLDYLGWQIISDRLQENAIAGVLLIDELEQHLHPHWQRYFIQRLRDQFGMTQVIASSHTPLIAAGVADIPRSQVVRLVATDNNSVEIVAIPTEDLTGKRADQILADAFGLVTSRSPGSLVKIDRYTELMSKRRSQAEEQEFGKLRNEFDEAWSRGDSAIMRAADKVVTKVLDEMVDQVPKNIDVHVKEKLLELFAHEEKSK